MCNVHPYNHKNTQTFLQCSILNRYVYLKLGPGGLAEKLFLEWFNSFSSVRKAKCFCLPRSLRKEYKITRKKACLHVYIYIDTESNSEQMSERLSVCIDLLSTGTTDLDRFDVIRSVLGLCKSLLKIIKLNKMLQKLYQYYRNSKYLSTQI